MPYYTGTINTVAALKSTIESLCVSNGWTLSAQDYLYKGLSFVKLTALTGLPTIDSLAYDALTIIGANSSDGLTTPAPITRYQYIPSGIYPVEYHISIQTNPDIVVCVVKVSDEAYRVLMFGDIVKVNNAAFVGGNFFWASHVVKDNVNDRTMNREFLNAIGNTDFVAGGLTTAFATFTTVIPFSNWNSSGAANRNYAEGFHAEIGDNLTNSRPWGASAFSVMPQTVFTDATRQALYRSPNTWTSQAILVPMNLQQRMADSLWSYIGYIEHMRLIRIDNYNPKDILTIGTDQWIVFPWLQKGITERSGHGFTGSLTMLPLTGTVGFALKYDPV